MVTISLDYGVLCAYNRSDCLVSWQGPWDRVLAFGEVLSEVGYMPEAASQSVGVGGLLAAAMLSGAEIDLEGRTWGHIWLRPELAEALHDVLKDAKQHWGIDGLTIEARRVVAVGPAVDRKPIPDIQN